MYFQTSIGSIGFRPNISSKGANLVLSSLVQLKAYSRDGMFFFQFNFFSVSNVPSMSKKVMFRLSIQPFPIEWYGVVLDLVMPVRLHSSLIISDTKFAP